MARSGTSAVARVLSLCGGVLPERLVGPHAANPRGHWEPSEALELNDRFLHESGSNWFDPSPRVSACIDPGAPSSVAFVADIRKLLRSWPPGNILIVKDPRITALANLWIEAARREGFAIKVVIAVRDPLEIAMSLTARDGMPENHAALLTLKYSFLAEWFSRGLPRVFVSYDRLLHDWRHQVARMESALDLEFPRVESWAIDNFLTPDLHRQRRPSGAAPRADLPALLDVHQAFLAAANDVPLDLPLLDRRFAEYLAYGKVWPNAAKSFLMHYSSSTRLADHAAGHEPTGSATAAMSPVIDRPDRRLHLLPRLTSYCQRARLRGRLFRSLVSLATEYVRATSRDGRERWRMQPRITRIVPGVDALAPSCSVAVFVHYAPTPTVSSMVLAQLESYRKLGFRILFVSMAPELPVLVLKQVADRVAMVVQRRNVGHDFGAWRDMSPFLSTGAAQLRELLLVNDSVCGPVRPLEPIVEDMRAAGDGFFGMTESLAPIPHLQSYFVLARGEAAISDVIAFLAQYRQTSYKRGVVRRGEIGLTTWMRGRGHAVAARFGYEPVEKTALESPIARQRLRQLFPRLFAGLDQDQAGGFAGRLRHYPLNPAHSLWRELVEVCDFPFLKTELLLRNPIGVSDVHNWRSLLHSPGQSEQSHESAQSIETHLNLMRRGAGTRF